MTPLCPTGTATICPTAKNCRREIPVAERRPKVSTVGKNVKTNQAPAGATEFRPAKISAAPAGAFSLFVQNPVETVGYFLSHLRRLNIPVGPIILFPCRFTNFIAKSANATAKSSSAPAIGREPRVRTAVQKSCPRSFPCSPRPAPAAMTRRRVRTAAAAVVAAIATDIEFR